MPIQHGYPRMFKYKCLKANINTENTSALIQSESESVDASQHHINMKYVTQVMCHSNHINDRVDRKWHQIYFNADLESMFHINNEALLAGSSGNNILITEFPGCDSIILFILPCTHKVSFLSSIPSPNPH